MGSMVFTIMAALAQREHEIKRERVTDSISKRREVGKDLGGRQTIIEAKSAAAFSWSRVASWRRRLPETSDCAAPRFIAAPRTSPRITTSDTERSQKAAN